MDITPLSLPPEGSFPLFEALLDSVQAHTRAVGYAFVTGKSKRRKGRIIKVLNCKRGRKQQPKVLNEDYRIRNHSITRNNCPIFIKVRERIEGDWDIQHQTIEVQHNHPLGEAIAFPEHRRLDIQQTTIVASYYLSGIAPSRTVSVLCN
jgi:hypothetical protein